MIASGNATIKTRFGKTDAGMLNLPKNRQAMKKRTTTFLNIQTTDERATVLLYGDIGDGDKVESARVVSELMSLDAAYGKIDVRINSRGGDVFSGMAIYNTLRQMAADVTIYVDGLAASIAAIIALCGRPMYMSPWAKLMLHSVSGGAWGNASDLRKTADQIEALERDLSEMIAKRLGMEADEVRQTYFDESDHWIDAEDCVRMGLADGLYDMGEADAEAQPSDEEEIYQYFNNRLREPQNNKDMALIDDIKALPSFENKEDNASIVAHIKELENKATKAEAQTQAIAQYQARIAELEAKEVDSYLDSAIASGKIKAEQKEQYKKLMAADRAATESLIDSMKPAPKAGPMAKAVYQEAVKSGFENKTWDELDRSNQLGALKAQNPELFQAKYKEKYGVEYAV